MNSYEVRRDFNARQIENIERRIAERAERMEQAAIAISTAQAARRARDRKSEFPGVKAARSPSVQDRYPASSGMPKRRTRWRAGYRIR